MKKEGNSFIFEKLTESNPTRRTGEIGKAQPITMPEISEKAHNQNTRGSFSFDANVLTSMKTATSKIASLKTAIA